MRIYRILGLRIGFSIDLAKRMTIDIPDWADDCWSYSSDDKPHCIRYYKGGTAYYIDLPKCKRVEVISVDNLYNKDMTGYNNNRKIVVDLYL